MIVLSNEVLVELLAHHEPPCLSLYQPTHRRHPENQQDPVRFRNLVREMEASLRQKYPAAEAGGSPSHSKPSPAMLPSGTTRWMDWPCWAGRACFG